MTHQPQAIPIDLLTELLTEYAKLTEKNRYRVLGAIDYYLKEQEEQKSKCTSTSND